MVMDCRSRWFGLEQEGFGIVFVEAAAAGVAQIAGRSGGSHDAVRERRHRFRRRQSAQRHELWRRRSRTLMTTTNVRIDSDRRSREVARRTIRLERAGACTFASNSRPSTTVDAPNTSPRVDGDGGSGDPASDGVDHGQRATRGRLSRGRRTSSTISTG